MKFAATDRSTQGTGASRRLRNAGKIPAIIYATTDTPAVLIELDHNELWHAAKKEAFHNAPVELEVNGQTIKVQLRDIQYHPYRQQILHLDFQRAA